jgi:hypothetical protein
VLDAAVAARGVHARIAAAHVSRITHISRIARRRPRASTPGAQQHANECDASVGVHR